LGIATFCLALSSGYVFNLFKKNNTLLLLPLLVLIIAANVQFFKGDIWYQVNDSYFTNGEEWDRQRVASIRDYWPKLGHEIPPKPSDGTYINYFPGWVGKESEHKGLIFAEGAKFSNTPVRKVGNAISLFAMFGTIVYLIKIWKK
jgi:hypothetical protein